jgi:3-oxoadipate enol-lactonase
MRQESSNTNTIIFIHGFPLNSKMWRFQENHFSDFRMYAPDLPGSAKTIPNQLFTLDMMAEYVINSYDSKIQSHTIVGLSMGGYIALRIAKLKPEFCNALVLVDTRASSDSEQAKLNRTNTIKELKKNGVESFLTSFLPNVLSKHSLNSNPELVEFLEEIGLEQTKEGLISQLLAMQGRSDSTSDLSSLSIPTLCICGEEDKLTTVEEMKSLSEKIPNSSFKTISKSAHYSPLENPEEFNQILSEFLKSI